MLGYFGKLSSSECLVEKPSIHLYRGSPTSTVPTSTNSTSTNFSAIGIKFLLVEFVISKFVLVEFSLCTQLVPKIVLGGDNL